MLWSQIIYGGRKNRTIFDQFLGHRSMLSYTDAGRRPYDMCPCKKNLKNRPVPGRLSNSLVMCKSLKSYDVSYICDYSRSLDVLSCFVFVFVRPLCCVPPLNPTLSTLFATYFFWACFLQIFYLYCTIASYCAVEGPLVKPIYQYTHTKQNHALLLYYYSAVSM